MHNHRLYCANALLLRNNKYCELCLEKRYFFNGIWKRCKGNSLLKSAIYSLYGYSLRTIGLRNIRKFVVFSGKHKELILRSKLAQTDQILVLPHFVKFDDLSHSQSSSSLSDGKIKKSRLIFVGRLSIEKGLEPLLIGVAKNSSITIDVIGDGPLRVIWKKNIQNLTV